MKFELNGARERQAFYFNKKMYRLNEGSLPKPAFEYAKEKFGIKEIKPKVNKKGDE